MKDLSRRAFFGRSAFELIDRLDLGFARPATSSVPMNSEQDVDWIVVGRTSEFVPGVEREVKVKDVPMTLRSCPEGFWAERNDGVESRRVALQVIPGGVVMANFNLIWPRNRVLSHLTNEPTDLELQDEMQAAEEIIGDVAGEIK